MRPRAAIIVLAWLLMLPLAANGVAQSLQVGTIEGRVIDQSGGVVPGVTVTVTSPVLITLRTSVTDACGRRPNVLNFSCALATT